jgi:hypothetical protein
MTEPNHELLPCPFCGGKAEYVEPSEDYYHGHDGYFECSVCMCSRLETAEQWNTRATVTPSDRAAALEWFEETLGYGLKGAEDLYPMEVNTIRAALQHHEVMEMKIQFLQQQIDKTAATNLELSKKLSNRQQPDDCKTCNTYAAQGLEMMRRLEENKAHHGDLVKALERQRDIYKRKLQFENPSDDTRNNLLFAIEALDRVEEDGQHNAADTSQNLDH